MRRPLATLVALALLTACRGDRATDPASPDGGPVIGIGGPSANVDLPPACAAPAPLLGSFDSRAPGYIVQLRDGTDVDATADRLAAALGFTVSHRFKAALTGFSTSDGTPAAIAALRCDAAVKLVEHDGVGTVS